MTENLTTQEDFERDKKMPGPQTATDSLFNQEESSHPAELRLPSETGRTPWSQSRALIQPDRTGSYSALQKLAGPDISPANIRTQETGAQ